MPRSTATSSAPGLPRATPRQARLPARAQSDSRRRSSTTTGSVRCSPRALLRESLFAEPPWAGRFAAQVADVGRHIAALAEAGEGARRARTAHRGGRARGELLRLLTTSRCSRGCRADTRTHSVSFDRMNVGNTSRRVSDHEQQDDVRRRRREGAHGHVVRDLSRRDRGADRVRSARRTSSSRARTMRRRSSVCTVRSRPRRTFCRSSARWSSATASTRSTSSANR